MPTNLQLVGMRRNGYETLGRHTLEHERKRFGEFMGRLTEHLRRLGPRIESRGP